MGMIMVVIVASTIGLGIILSGVGIAPYLSLDALILTIVAPAAIVMIGTPPSAFFGAFRLAFHLDTAVLRELRVARAIIAGTGRAIGLSVAVFSLISGVAVLVDTVPGTEEYTFYLSRGTATILAHVLYALVARTLFIQPLIVRVERVIAAVDIPGEG